MLDTELRRKLAWLIALTAPGSFPFDPLFFLIGLTYALTIFYAETLRYADHVRWLVNVQLAGDALVVSAFIHVTGGVASYFSLLYVLPIVAGSTVQFRRGGLLVATLSTALYVTLVIGQYAAGNSPARAVSPAPSSTLPPRVVAEYTVALNVFTFFAVALLSGSLSEELRSAGVRLVQASSEIADLQALNEHVIESL